MSPKSEEDEASESQGEALGSDNDATSTAEEHEVESAEATAEAEARTSDDSLAEAEIRGAEDHAEGPAATESETVVRAEATGAPQPHRRRDQRDRPRPPRRRQYKIQEVIKRRQIMLVQVVKEERGNKGASLTTFLSLAGRYCVLMPNTPRGGGISRKITNAADRKRLKAAAQSLELPEGMGLIIRTAGANRTKLEIKRDYEYLLRLWDTVRELTLKSNAPALVYEEGSLIKRAIRDLYNKDTSDILVDGEAGYRDAKDFMRMLMPSHAKNVKLYKEALPLFQRHQVEAQLDAMFSPLVTLRSGGYIVINQTEALVSIDVNSGKATREHSIEETAYKTNLEASDEIARQLRLRDLAGLVVIDFIDMEDAKNDRNVEKRLHNAVRGDRARIQIGKISQFGLLEMSRQRLRAGVVAGSTVTCPHCNGQGIIRSTESAALRLLRALDEEGQRAPSANLTVKAPQDVTIYTLNQKRREIDRIEDAYNLGITFEPTATMMGGSFEIDRTGVRAPQLRPKTGAISVEAGFQERPEIAEPEVEETEDEETAEAAAPSEAQARPSAPPQPQQPAAPDGDGMAESGAAAADGAAVVGAAATTRVTSRSRANRNTIARMSLVPSKPKCGPMTATTRPTTEEPSEAVAATAPEPGHAQNASAPQQEGGGRRRRRRRGRRGRRPDGEFSNGAQRPHEAQSEFHSAPFEHSGFEPREESAPPRAAEANAPSSPQWSLNEQRGETERRRTRTGAFASCRSRKLHGDDSLGAGCRGRTRIHRASRGAQGVVAAPLQDLNRGHAMKDTPYGWSGNATAHELDNAAADVYLGKYILVGVTYVDQAGQVEHSVQMHGVVESASQDGITIALKGERDGTVVDHARRAQARFHRRNQEVTSCLKPARSSRTLISSAPGWCRNQRFPSGCYHGQGGIAIDGGWPQSYRRGLAGLDQ